MYNRANNLNVKMVLKRQGTALLAVSLVFLYSLIPTMLSGSNFGLAGNVYAMADNQLTAKSTGDEEGIQGGSANISILVENGRSQTATLKDIKLTVGGSGITVTDNDGDVTVPGRGSHTISFPLDISKAASEGEHTCNFSATVTGLTNVTSVEKQFTFEVFENMASQGKDNNPVSAVNITNTISPSGGFSEGNGNTFSVSFFNNGNTTIKNAKVMLTLPEGLSVYNGSNTDSLGYIAVGDTKKSSFTITVDKSVESKNYPIDVEIKGLDTSNNDVTINKTFYVPISGKDAFSANNIEISKASIPAEMPAGQNFDMSFAVKNTGTTEVSSLKITVEPAEGIINKSKNIFVDKLASGESKNYSVTFYTFEGADQKSYPIKITAAPTTSSSESTDVSTQYATVMITSSGKGAKTPQLMVDNYTYGGSNVQAGSDFILNLGLLNTSGKTLTNVKVSITTEEGTFVPTDSSNSFFIDEIKPKSHYTKSLRLTVKPDAVEKTTPITVSTKYEDASQNPYESTDIISVPVTQQTKLVIDELVPPTEVYVGEAGTCELQFYNMGKTVLNNLRANVEGNFDTMESNSYFAGNMEKGKSDSYRFSFIPRAVGPMEGVITFSFEDSNGDPQYQEVPFSFEVMDMPVFEEDPSMEEDTDKKVPWSLIIAGAVVALAVIGVLVFKKIRKKKMHNALEIDDDYDISLKDDDEVTEAVEEAQIEKEDAGTDRQDTKADKQ